MKIVFATQNKGKLKEMENFLIGFDVVSALEAGVSEDVVEDGKTLEENALKKARFVCEKTGEWAVADDTGLFIDALDGRPGIYAARWAGEDSTDNDKIEKVLSEMKEVDKKLRTAKFESCLALVSPGGEEYIFSGVLPGEITIETRGKMREKLPYDLVFLPLGHDKTMAEMSDEEKNSLSHRGLAFQKLKKFLEKEFHEQGFR